MDIKRRLIRTLPPSAKRLLSVPYDFMQTRRADRRFSRKEITEREPADDAPENIVIVVVDALRGDIIDEDLTPFLAGLNGVRDAVAPAPWTFPSVSSILTGVYPHEHGAMRQDDKPDESEGLSLPPQMDEGRETLTEVLAGAGYRTRGVFGHDTPFVSLAGRFHDHKLYHNINSDDGDVLQAYLSAVEDSGTKEFGYIHLAGPHIPVDPPEKYWEKHEVDRSIDNIQKWEYNEEVDCGEECQRYREHRRRLYRASADYADDAIRRFHKELTEELDDVLFFVTSDHGECMWEHVELDVEQFGGSGCVDHGGTPYEEVSRVPLLTDGETSFAGDYTSLVDITPTILAEVGLEGAVDVTGRHISDERNDSQVLVEGCMSGYEKKAVYKDSYKLVVSKGDGSDIGFRLPGEQRTEIPEETRKEMLSAFPQWPQGEDGDGEDVSAVVEDRLADLGYK